METIYEYMVKEYQAKAKGKRKNSPDIRKLLESDKKYISIKKEDLEVFIYNIDLEIDILKEYIYLTNKEKDKE